MPLNDLNRKIAELSAANRLYQDLIHDLYPRLDMLSAQKVKRAFRDPRIEASSAVYSSPRCISPVDSSSTLVELLKAPAYKAKIGDDSILFTIKDFTDEDLNSSQHMQATGYVGEHSATAWLFELKRNLVKETNTKPSDKSSGKTGPLSISAMSYFQNEINIQIHGSAELLAAPPREVGDRLLKTYFRNVHPEFPVIGKITFCWQYRSYFSNPNARPGKRWIALLNLVCAIAARFSPLDGGHREGRSDGHAKYFARAWQLSIGHAALADHPDLQQVQVEALAAFYLLCVGEINRCDSQVIPCTYHSLRAF